MHNDWLMRHLSRFERRHARVFAGIRFASGIWLLILTAILYGYDRGGWWRPLLVVAASAHFYVAYRLTQFAAQQRHLTS